MGRMQYKKTVETPAARGRPVRVAAAPLMMTGQKKLLYTRKGRDSVKRW